MKSFSTRSCWALLGAMALLQPLGAAEPFGSASLLPMPSTQPSRLSLPNIAPTSYGFVGQEEIIPSASDHAPPAPGPGYAPPVQGPGQGPGQAPFAPPPAALSPEYQHAMKQSWDGACADGSCGEAACDMGCCGRPCPRFYGYVGGLVMGRANQCDTVLSQYQPGNYNTLLTTGDADQEWTGGLETRFGWVLPGCCNAIEFGYWGLWPDDEAAYINGADFPGGGIAPALGANLDQVWYDDGQGNNMSVYDWMSTSTGQHYITRSFDFHSAEVNFLGNTAAWGAVPFGAGYGNCNGCVPCGSCGPSCLQFGWLAGFRYLQFNESLLFQTDYDDTYMNGTGDYDELSYYIDTNNSLFGFQMGGQGAWYLNKCWSLYGGARFGVFNNHVESSQYLAGLNGDAYINNGAYAGELYRYSADSDALACLGQIDLGMRYQLGCHWSVTGGYRVVGVSGVATAPSQISDNFLDPSYLQNICADDSVILHGAYAGVQFAW